jgi:hypothetical protein
MSAHSFLPECFYDSGGGDELFTFRVLDGFQNAFGVVVDLRFGGVHLCDAFSISEDPIILSVQAGRRDVYSEYFAGYRNLYGNEMAESWYLARVFPMGYRLRKVVRKTGRWLFGEGSEAGFVDFEDDAGVAVGYFADVVFGGGAEDLGYLGWGEFVVFR